MSGTPTWFGRRSLLGWVHQPPDETARGAVVLCPPFGMDLLASYATLRVLADRLAANGLLAMRFDYPGTGDSAGDYRDPAQLEAWLDGISEAVAYVRSAGATSVSVVGLRMGALLAAHALPRCGDISELVLWDPCVSGKGYLREQTTLYRLRVDAGEPETPDAKTPGMVFSADTAADVRGLSLTDADLSATSVLLMPRPQVASDPAIAAIAARPGIEVFEASQQAMLLDVAPHDAVVPHATIDYIAAHLAQRATSVGVPTDCKWSNEAIVAVTPDGRSIVERFDRVGPRGLFTITTSAEDLLGPTLVCVSQANAHRVGPARMWPEMAREAAARGVRAVRYDRRSVGGSPADESSVPGFAIGTGLADGATLSAYSDEAVVDLVDVVKATCPDESSLALIGVCSGGWVATVAAAADVHPRAIYLVNQGIWRRRPAPGAKLSVPTGQTPAPTAPTAPPQHIDDHPLGWRGRLKRRIKPLVPYAVRLLRAKRGGRPVAEVLLAPVVNRGIVVRLYFHLWDAELFAWNYGLPAYRRLRRRGTLSMRVEPVIEHSLVSAPGRQLIRQLVLDEVVSFRER